MDHLVILTNTVTKYLKFEQLQWLMMPQKLPCTYI